MWDCVRDQPGQLTFDPECQQVRYTVVQPKHTSKPDQTFHLGPGPKAQIEPTDFAHFGSMWLRFAKCRLNSTSLDTDMSNECLIKLDMKFPFEIQFEHKNPTNS